MLRSYFFIPASKSRFIEKMKTIAADEFVIDFEDAVAESEHDVAFINASNIENRQQYWVRPRLFNRNGEINIKQLESLFDLGFKRYVLPKINTTQQLQDIYNVFDYYDFTDIQWILLLESPLALFNIPALFEDKRYPIKGIALGAQDYAAEVGMSFSTERIQWARNVILNAAYAYNVEAIDYASMTIVDMKVFEEEAVEGFRMGYTAKMVLHPTQLQVLENIDYYTAQEIDHAIKIGKQIDFDKLSDFSVIMVDGRLYEKPHLKRVQRVLEYARKRNLL
jgi:citrate lyase beta subunit